MSNSTNSINLNLANNTPDLQQMNYLMYVNSFLLIGKIIYMVIYSMKKETWNKNLLAMNEKIKSKLWIIKKPLWVYIEQILKSQENIIEENVENKKININV